MGTPVQTLPIAAAALREVGLVGVFRYAHAYPEALALLARQEQEEEEAKEGKQHGDSHARLPSLRKAISHRVHGFDSIPEAFALTTRGVDDKGQKVRKVMIEM